MVHFQPIFDLVSSTSINHHISESYSDGSLLPRLLICLSKLCNYLTRYNKSLLGNDLGKFPAPLLMNTVHFAMQAVISKSITWYWSHRFQPSVAMSWRDYFMRGKLILFQSLYLCLYINLACALFMGYFPVSLLAKLVLA